ncbi:PREDICTED: TATA box-binding protein-associated factor RNA polymerase I subunit B [Rhagoletis zephyria]|uniref:TATA box-binding protein-associated factor RNA polymerase I subunit B n=1 Tax=Rhagoletis zephyria TaxID=28612 RepID=UPI00081181B4|nr:PREDICTED: TATA box-binding protein-associated factor RNA polymerase I subunit B [Rhagoletis zephyria]
MEDGDELITSSNLSCKVCGERQFTLREGYYYCQECGTKQEQVRAVQVERDADFLEAKLFKKQKIKIAKAEKPNLTSWECYNYILRGLVNDLLSFGAKEDLKLMSLQLWAAYLRRMEVAFFNKKRVELPRLGLRFLQRDASAVYNHALQRRAGKRKRRQTDDSRASVVSSETVSTRQFRKNRRKLDESSYSLHSSMNSTDVSQTTFSSANTSSTGTTGRAIKLQFSARARKHLKKVMPVKHIEKHALDAEGSLKCHRLKPLARSISRTEHALLTMNVRQIYTILGIALNLIGDDIQLSDLVRLIDEDHVSSKDVIQYFPENIAPYCKEMLHEIQFYIYPTKYSDKVLREHIGLLSKFLNIREFVQPKMIKLAERYVTELNLPPDVTAYVEHLINLLPPQMRTRTSHEYPAYEARTMAYIIFVLKLSFGLDGHTEKLISRAATTINQCLQKLSEEGRCINSQLTPPSLLFVWEDWVNFVEMRKVIVSHYNSNFCRQFKQCQSTSQLLEEVEEVRRTQLEEAAHKADDATKENTSKIANMNRVFQQFVDEYTQSAEPVESINFPPSLTPAHSYFKRILLHCSNAGTSATFKIPEFMRIDHMQRTLAPYTHSKELKDYFKQHNWVLNVRRIPCTGERNKVGVFRPANEKRERVENEMYTKKIDFDISEEEWRTSKEVEELIEELEFKTEYDRYEKNYVKKLQADALKRQQAIYAGPSCEPDDKEPDGERDTNKSQVSRIVETDEEDSLSPAPERTLTINEEINVRSMHSINAFSECDMEPIKSCDSPIVLNPRRGLNNVRLFADLSDDEANDEILGDDDSNDISNIEERSCTLLTSNMDCWTLLGYSHNLTVCQKKLLESKFPRSFFWLLETCAQSINVDWCVIYEELLTIELMFAYGVEDLNDFKDYIRFKYNNPIKDFNMLINTYRELW